MHLKKRFFSTVLCFLVLQGFWTSAFAGSIGALVQYRETPEFPVQEGRIIDKTPVGAYVVQLADGKTVSTPVDRLQFHESALVVIDVQPSFLKEQASGNEPAEVTYFFENIIDRIHRAKRKNKKIILVEYDFGNGSPEPTDERIREAVGEDYPHLIRVSKNQDGGAEEIQSALKERDLTIKHMRICGLNTQACVQSTVRGLFYSSMPAGEPVLHMTIDADACSSQRGLGMHESALLTMAEDLRNVKVVFDADKGVSVISEEDPRGRNFPPELRAEMFEAVGLIWSGRAPKLMNFEDAAAYCEGMGAALPSQEQWDSLIAARTRQSRRWYQRHPEPFNQEWSWSSTPGEVWLGKMGFVVFDGYAGNTRRVEFPRQSLTVRCVRSSG